MTPDKIAVDVTLVDDTGPGAASAKRNIESLSDTSASTASKVSSNLKSLGSSLKSIGSALTIGVTVPLVAIGAASMKMASDFQQDMTLIQTQAGASASTVAMLSQQIIAMSEAGSEFTPDQLAQGMYHIMSVGVPLNQAMSDLVVTNKLAAVGNANLTDTTNAVVVAWRSGVEGASTFGQAANTLNAIVGAGNMTLGQLTQALGSTGLMAAAKSAGLSLQDVGAAEAYLSDATGDPISSATHLRMALALIQKPSTAAATALQSIGISSSQLGVDLQTGGLPAALDALKTHLNDTFGPTTLTTAETYASVLKTKGVAAANAFAQASQNAAQVVLASFGGAKSGAVMEQLLNGYSTGTLAQKEKQVGDTSGSANADYAATQKTTAFEMKSAWADINASMVGLGTTLNTKIMPILVPFMASLAKDLLNIVDGFDRLNPKQQMWILGIAGAAIALGPLLVGLGILVGTVGVIVGAAVPLGITILVIAALALAADKVITHWKQLTQFFSGYFTTLQGIFQLGVAQVEIVVGILTANPKLIEQGWKNLGPAMQKIFAGLAQQWRAGALGMANAFISGIAPMLGPLGQMIQALEFLGQLLGSLGSNKGGSVNLSKLSTMPDPLKQLMAGGSQGSTMNYAGSFATGGVIPGPVGAAQLAIVHGGETVTPPGQSAGGGQGGGAGTVNIIFSGHVDMSSEVGITQTAQLLARQMLAAKAGSF